VFGKKRGVWGAHRFTHTHNHSLLLGTLIFPMDRAARERALAIEIQCCVCHAVPALPWHGCAKEGHVICNGCRTKLASYRDGAVPVYTCPQCAHAGADMHCRHLEEYVRHIELHVPCPVEGCTQVVSAIVMAAHVKTCPNLPWSCLVDPACTWSGPRIEALAHVRLNHPCPELHAGVRASLGNLADTNLRYFHVLVPEQDTENTLLLLTRLTESPHSKPKARIKHLRCICFRFSATGEVLRDHTDARLLIEEQAAEDLYARMLLHYMPATRLEHLTAFRSGTVGSTLLVLYDTVVDYSLVTTTDAAWRKRPADADDDAPANKKQKITIVEEEAATPPVIDLLDK
jgi:hypothetical protein